MSELTETLEEVETAIRRYSEELIQALALRDELDYEKEVLPFDFFTVTNGQTVPPTCSAAKQLLNAGCFWRQPCEHLL